MESKYYIPAVEDLRIGQEVEIYHGEGFYQGESIDQKKNGHWSINFILDGSYLDYVIGLLKLNNVRVPYLTKEQIEREGWIFKSTNKMRWWFEGNEAWFNKDIPDSPSGRYWGFQLVFDPELHIVQILTKTNGGEQTYESFFQGFCKSINELRTLHKWLGI